MQQLPTPAMQTPSQNQLFPTPMTELDDAICQREWITSNALSNNVSIETPAPYLRPKTQTPTIPKNLDIQCIGTKESVPIIQCEHTLWPTRTYHLDATIARLQDHLNYMALQNTQHYAMMAKVHAKILEDLQQIAQLMPTFLAKLSKHIHAPSMPQPYDNLQNTQTAQTSPHSWM